MNNRILWIDWARIIGMYSIIFGHFFAAHGSGFVYSFSVPLFFFISGYLIKENSCDCRQAWRKIFMPLVVPMIIFLFVNWFILLKHNDFAISETIIEPWLRALFGRHYPLLGTLWFVYDLIIIKFIFLISSKKLLRLMAIASLAMMFLLDHFSIYKSSVLINIWGGFFFVWLGNECNKINCIGKVLSSQIKVKATIIRFCVAIILAAFIFVFSENKPIYIMLTNSYSSFPAVTIIFALLGIAMIILISSILFKLPQWLHLLNIGAIPVLALHEKVVGYLTYYYNNIDPTSPFYSSYGYAIWSLVILLGHIPLIWLLNKFVPWACGKRTLRH